MIAIRRTFLILALGDVPGIYSMICSRLAILKRARAILLYDHPTFSKTLYLVFYVLNVLIESLLDDSQISHFDPRDVPDLSYVSFLPNSNVEVEEVEEDRLKMEGTIVGRWNS
ncbi:hypothetical protein Tco_0327048 [Tanacetum coccineum]